MAPPLSNSSSAARDMGDMGDKRIRKRPKMEKVMGTEVVADFISNLPNEILIIILSKLRIDESVRCGVLSKRWLGLWKHTLHIEVDMRYMIKPITQLLQARKPRTLPDFNTLSPSMLKVGYGCNTRVILLILSHSGLTSSCRFRHLNRSFGFGEVETCIDLLIDRKKTLKDLSLECVSDCKETAEKIVSEENTYILNFPPGSFETLGSLELINYTIDCCLPFEKCSVLKNLKLKRIYLDDVTLSGILENCVLLENFMLLESTGFESLVIVKSKLKVLQIQALCVEEIEIIAENLEVLLLDSIICSAKDVSIHAPFLKTFRSYNYSMYARMVSNEERKSIMKAHQIFARCADLLGEEAREWQLSKNSHVANRIPTRAGPTTCNIFRNLSTLSMDLDLNNIREAGILSYIMRLCTNLQVIEIALPVFRPRNPSGSSSSHSDSTFWERRELCYCIHQKLKFVYMRGFRGKEQEVEFAKYLITRATAMERITLICSDSMGVAENLLSLPKASGKLSINLKLNANNPLDEFDKHQNRLLKR
ncbi:F-box protein At1g80960-like [Abrus precatorius]|uniref:F-box protein At1g80960-like n=1 Tax=Abrus precatorius TaxID=3816 RepID=A0A8B8KGT0_ABRPR|nr:F-box protein At1g80960-like [Abrus precatorius]